MRVFFFAFFYFDLLLKLSRFKFSVYEVRDFFKYFLSHKTFQASTPYLQQMLEIGTFLAVANHMIHDFLVFWWSFYPLHEMYKTHMSVAFLTGISQEFHEINGLVLLNLNRGAKGFLPPHLLSHTPSTHSPIHTLGSKRKWVELSLKGMTTFMECFFSRLLGSTPAFVFIQNPTLGRTGFFSSPRLKLDKRFRCSFQGFWHLDASLCVFYLEYCNIATHKFPPLIRQLFKKRFSWSAFNISVSPRVFFHSKPTSIKTMWFPTERCFNLGFHSFLVFFVV